jgi:hypothetical protein
MSWIVVNIHRIMMVSGLLTSTMVHAAVAPEAAFRSTFGEDISGPAASIVVRNWRALIAADGSHADLRTAQDGGAAPCTNHRGCQQIFFALVLSHGGRFF